jgi:hypothetical protein
MNLSRAASFTHAPGSPCGAEPAAPVMRLIPSMSRLLANVLYFYDTNVS